MNRYGTARVSKRRTDETAARQLRAALLESKAQTRRQNVRTVILHGEVALVVTVMTVCDGAGHIIAEPISQADLRVVPSQWEGRDQIVRPDRDLWRAAIHDIVVNHQQIEAVGQPESRVDEDCVETRVVERIPPPLNVAGQEVPDVSGRKQVVVIVAGVHVKSRLRLPVDRRRV